MSVRPFHHRLALAASAASAIFCSVETRAIDPMSMMKHHCGTKELVQVLRETVTGETVLGSLEERIDFYRQTIDRIPLSEFTRTNPNGLYCTWGACMVVSETWTTILKKLHLPIKRYPLTSHGFIVDARLGAGKEILIDPTYLQTVRLSPDEMKKVSPIFVGTLDDMKKFLTKHEKSIQGLYVTLQNEPKVQQVIDLLYKPGNPDSPFQFPTQ